MELFYPLTFAENRHDALWGSEAWEISGHPSSPSIVAEGAFAGRALDDVAAEFGRSFMGEMAPSATDFPLLFKVIDARSRLSVQVHPSETTCPFTGGEPKTEMWRVISGSGPIFAGLKPGTTQDVVAGNVLKGGFEESLVRHQARPGLTLFIPGGLVHAIGEDVVLYEVQQSSNTTFRLYDWGRVDAGGKPRELHVDSALKAIDYALPPPEPRDSVVCPFFSFRAIEARGNVKVPARADSFTALYIVEERRSVLVPANCAAVIPARGTVFATTLGD